MMEGEPNEGPTGGDTLRGVDDDPGASTPTDEHLGRALAIAHELESKRAAGWLGDLGRMLRAALEDEPEAVPTAA